jgi:branched-chain amino acid transport system permease protein
VVRSLGELAKLMVGDAPGLDLVIYGLALVLVIWFTPRGLIGLVADARKWRARHAPAPPAPMREAGHG